MSGGTVVGLIRTHDWRTTSLGDPLTWPSRLQHLTELVLGGGLPAFVVCGPDHVIIYNEAFAAQCGDRHPGAFGRSLNEVLPDLWQIVAPHYNRALHGRNVNSLEVQWPAEERGGGGKAQLILTPIRNGRQAADWVLGQFVSVEQAGSSAPAEPTAQPSADGATEALRVREERFDLALRIGRIATWDWNMETGQIAWSDEHFRMEGYEPGEVKPSFETWSARLHPDDRDATKGAVLAARDEHRLYEREFRFLHPDGRVVWSAALGQFFYDDAGNPIRMVGAMRDVTDHHKVLDTQEVLIAELQHRTRNLIAVVRSLSRKTLERSVSLDDFYKRFEQRLAALARVQGLLSRLEHDDRVTFDELIRMELSVHGAVEDGERLILQGPAGVRLRSSTVQTLALALHELATNAVKYGALGDGGGKLLVRWHLDDGGTATEPVLAVEWRETEVSMLAPAEPLAGGGYGRELIERALPYQLSAETSFSLEPEGIRCTIRLPVSHQNLPAPR